MKIIIIILSVLSLLIPHANSNEYIYQGENPNNYIIFNNELWRIISKEKNIIKIIRNESIGNMLFAEDTNEWEKSTIKKYLNNIYYKNLKEKDKIISHTFIISDKDEKEEKWTGKIGLLSINDYINAFNKDKNYLNNLIYNNSDNVAWTMNKDTSAYNKVYHFGNTYFGDSLSYFEYAIFPTLYLNVKLEGNGTIRNPFKIVD